MKNERNKKGATIYVAPINVLELNVKLLPHVQVNFLVMLSERCYYKPSFTGKEIGAQRVHTVTR